MGVPCSFPEAAAAGDEDEDDLLEVLEDLLLLLLPRAVSAAGACLCFSPFLSSPPLKPPAASASFTEDLEDDFDLLLLLLLLLSARVPFTSLLRGDFLRDRADDRLGDLLSCLLLLLLPSFLDALDKLRWREEDDLFFLMRFSAVLCESRLFAEGDLECRLLLLLFSSFDTIILLLSSLLMRGDFDFDFDVEVGARVLRADFPDALRWLDFDLDFDDFPSFSLSAASFFTVRTVADELPLLSRRSRGAAAAEAAPTVPRLLERDRDFLSERGDRGRDFSAFFSSSSFSFPERSRRPLDLDPLLRLPLLSVLSCPPPLPLGENRLFRASLYRGGRPCCPLPRPPRQLRDLLRLPRRRGRESGRR